MNAVESDPSRNADVPYAVAAPAAAVRRLAWSV
jgi:hypothetical protein